MIHYGYNSNSILYRSLDVYLRTLGHAGCLCVTSCIPELLKTVNLLYVSV